MPAPTPDDPARAADDADPTDGTVPSTGDGPSVDETSVAATTDARAEVDSATTPADAVDDDAGHPDVDGSPADGVTAVAGSATSWRERIPWTMVKRGVAIAGGVAVFLGALAIAGLAWLWSSVDVALVEPLEESTILLDRNGEEIAVLSRDGTRLNRPLDELPDHVPAALIAAEDRRFYEHDGVDLLAVARAAVNNLTEDDTEGGSTITQQLAKNRLVGTDRTFARKAREAVAAMKIERQLDKDQILEQYLNTVYFGRSAYGIEAAARAWFGIEADELTVGQSAFLMAILPAPEAFDPTEDPEGVTARRDAVLDAMAAMGTATEPAIRSAKARPLQVIEERPGGTDLAPHFVEHLRAELLDRYGEDQVYAGGLVVTTTLDLDRQRAAVAAVDAVLDDPDDPQVALVSIETDGSVSAWVGGRDFEALQVDTVSAAGGSGRQPGSTFKPIALARALGDGIGAGTRYAAPASVRLDVEGSVWEVSNAGGRDRGFLSLQQATVASVNTVFAQLALEVGPAAIASTAEDLGITADLRAHPSIALGAQEVTPLDLATAYATLSRRGVRIDPYVIRTVEADGRVIDRAEPLERRAISTGVADAVTQILSGTARRGTATRAALDRPMAAKTGTTQNNADGWLAGYTPQLTTVVWIGNPDANEQVIVDGDPLFGGSLPAEIWRRFMAAAHEGVPVVEFPEADARFFRDDSPSFAIETSARAAAGAPLSVRTGGIERCVSSWEVAIDGPTGEPDPAVMRSGVRGPDDSATFALELPAELLSGEYRVQLLCDTGSGGEVVASTRVEIVGIEPTTTTTSSTTTSTTTTEPDGDEGDGDEGDSPSKTTTTTTTTSPSTTTTSTTTTSTTSTTTTTTTTTAPEDRDRRGGGPRSGE